MKEASHYFAIVGYIAVLAGILWFLALSTSLRIGMLVLSSIVIGVCMGRPPRPDVYDSADRSHS